MRRLFRFAWRYRRRWLWGAVMLLLTNATAMAIPQLFRRAIDDIQQGAGIGGLREVAYLLVGVACAGACFRVLSRIFIFFAGRDAELDLRTALYDHLTTQDGQFFSDHSTGDLMSRASSDLAQVRLLLGPGILNIVNAVFAYSAAIPLMLSISVKLTLISLVVFPPSLWLMRVMSRVLYHRNKRQQEEMGHLTSVVQENLAGNHVVRAFVLEQAQEKRFAEGNQAYYHAAVSQAAIRSLLWRYVVALSSLGTLLAVYFGARDVLAGQVTLGELVALVEYMALLSWPTFALGWILSIWQRGAAAMARLDEIFDRPPVITSGHETQLPESLDVEVRNLTVRYERSTALDNISLKLPAGGTLGVVGPVGSGKSSFVQSLLRLIDIPENTVFLGGVDITALDLQTLRRAIAYVPQDPVLFSMTLRDNIAFGRPAATAESIAEAIDRAALRSDLDALPQGLDTPVGERGITLSGGQKQRTAIARALLLEAPLLVLDDSLSSVDAETEERILQGLREARHGRTTVVVAHRISAVMDADAIIVLDRGCIVEQGTHRDLLDHGGVYAAMARRQELEAGLGAETEVRKVSA